MARYIAKRYLENVLHDIQPEHLIYPK